MIYSSIPLTNFLRLNIWQRVAGPMILMCDALSYYMYMHSTEVRYRKYQIGTIDITERIENGGRKLQACSCGHKKPIVVISPLLERTCIKITCPRCGTKVIELLDGGRMIKTGKGRHSAEHTFNSLEVAINNSVLSWEIQCGKTTEYKVLALLISEFFGRMDVTPKVREYSQLLRKYVQKINLIRESARIMEKNWQKNFIRIRQPWI